MSETHAELILDQDQVAWLTLKRPQVHNAFDDALIAELIAHLQAATQAQARVLVLQSEGKSFSAGADLGWMRRMAEYSLEDNFKDAGELARLMHLLNALPMPTIARVQGAAYGGAVGLVACCDLAIASDAAKFCLSEVKIGLSPAVISPFVTRALGERAMRRYALTAEVMDAQTACHLGLVHQVTSLDQLDDAVQEQVKTLLANSPQAVAKTKELVRFVADRELDTPVIEYTQRLIAEIRVSAEGQEGLNAFLNKKTPSWRQA
ncbi:methylglutaconyl-CoA hydratase [Allopseudospirillum japonicum]|uniref:Methylglutaconyl-CoA hydratase n=1 Tax=Allopseudospirillum japonicum TaxID=64971 RepID=A0A1H6T4M7_9GAMM|nr:enoyl-CoA hydratase/isomerase family protein [Allopseudospirillum japonicum]SEI75053.1 methylglutaconyl-CoA hydratase [Allopseudospirillum japonicum]